MLLVPEAPSSVTKFDSLAQIYRLSVTRPTGSTQSGPVFEAVAGDS
jgi:hypothetical protein